MKVVVYHVKVPKREEFYKFSNQTLYSDLFTIDTGTRNESEWKICCQFNVRFKQTDRHGVGVFLELESGKIPFKFKFSCSIIKRKGEYGGILNFQNTGWLIPKKEYRELQKTGNSRGFYEMVSHDVLYNNLNIYFPDGNLRIGMKIIAIKEPDVDSKHIIDLVSTFEKLLDQEIFSDLIIKTSDNKQLKAH